MKRQNLLKSTLCLLMALVCNVAWADFAQTWTANPVGPWSATPATDVPAEISLCGNTDAVSESNPHTIHMAEQLVTSKGGDVTVNFTWTTGSHMLCMVGVDLVNSEGTVVYKDYHVGSTGSSHSNNTYTLTGVEAGEYTLRYFVCNKASGQKSHSLTNTNGTITVTGLDIPEKFYVYQPTTRATTLENGKKYMIYNTAFNGDEDRTGFLYDTGSGIGHSGAPKKKPATFQTISDAYLWEVVTTEESAEGHQYYLKAANGGYVNASGKTNNTDVQALYIQSWSTSQAPKAGVKSEGADETVIENANIGNDVWTICGTSVTSNGQSNGDGDCWNGNANTWAKWGSSHPFAFYEVSEEAVTFGEGFPVPGHTYYIYNNNDTRQYFYNDGGTLKVSETRGEWSNEYLFTCSYDGLYFQFKNLTGKYLAHKGLQDAAYNFELKEYEYNGEKRVALYSVAASRYFVMKYDATFDQATSTYNAETTDFSTSYVFEEFAFPKSGESYYIYSDTYENSAYVNRFLYADGSNLKLNTSLSAESAYQWTCIVTTDGKVQFRNGNGKYLAHKGVQDNPYNFTLNKGNANHAIAATLYSDAASRYFVVNNDGTGFDQANRTYDQTTEGYCTDFVFIPTSETKVVSVAGNSKAGATATWNGETKNIPASWIIASQTTISNPTLSVTCEGDYTFIGFYEGDAFVGNTIDITSTEESRSFTAKFIPNIFSASSDAENLIPVQIYSARNNAYTICLNAAENYNGHAVNSGTTDYTLNEVWHLVGTAESFKMYSHTAGTNLALTLAGTGSGSAATMTASGTDLCLVETTNGYTICPKGTTGQSFNMHGGNGHDIKLYDSTDGGSIWNFNIIDLTKPLTYSAAVDKVWESSPRVAELTTTFAGNSSTTRILGNVEGQTMYLPKGATFSLSSMTYRGYTFNGFSGADSYTDATLPEGGLEITASYTANDERTLFYSLRDGHPYRIPAIATAPNGDIFAICDYRPCNADIGYGEVDLVCRISSDNGVTWTDEYCFADGQGDAYAANDTSKIWQVGFGDPAIVADRERNEVLVMSVCGNQTCWDGTFGETDPNPNRMARVRITYDEVAKQWAYSDVEEVTYDIYPKFVDSEGNVHAASMFIGAGKICQSRVVKKGDYYRLYCSVWTVTKTQRQHHNYVIYSDDFGETWNVLGDLGYDNCPSKYGNEPKCEELPDGTVVLSSRKYYGRYFNLFKFDDNTYTTGSWQGEESSNDIKGGLSFGNNSTNGEIYKVKAIHKESGRICDLMFQSIPTGNGRSDVAVYYKEMEYSTAYTPTTFAQNWTLGKQVSTKGSCYSTMILQADGRIAFFFEEEPSGYCMVYIPYTIEDLTGDAYSLYTVESTISEHGIGTFYASEAMAIPEGVTAYVATEEPAMENGTGVITMTELEGIIPANTGAVIRGEADTYEFIPSISYGTAVEGNMLVGYEAADNKADSYSEVSLAEGYTPYVLTVKNEKAGFYKKGAGFKVYNHKAYLNVPTTTGAPALTIRFDGDGSTSIDNSQLTIDNSQLIYDLQGRRVVNPAKGIYIVNGKKVIR